RQLTMIMIGMTGILLIILGIRLTSYIEEQGKKQSNTIKRKAITLLLLSSAALTIYVTLPQALLVSGAVVLFPQSIGMWFSSLCLT
ncbi:GRP family sugar transporter, partial [Enterococcus sp. S181_ASV_20]|nr:GRP family sugar transporter [Enterococcus sp. S181_ASV_20]